MSSAREPADRRSVAIEAEAANWMARRDRGLTPREQDEYLDWLRGDARRAAAVAQAEATLRRVLQLAAWQHEHSAEPNPDLLARPRRQPAWRGPAVALAAALAVLLAGWWAWRAPAERPAVARAAPKNYLRVNERRALPDGSRAELRDGTQLNVRYTAGERRVRLIGGEAQFSVMKDPARPFVVEAAGVAVRAVGTVFIVRLDDQAVEVLVTEGKVRVGRAAAQPGEIFDPAATAAAALPVVAASQRAIVARHDIAAPPSVTDVSADEITRRLAWQAPRLQFDETPLADAIAEFNQRNRHQLVLGDPALGAQRIGGTFRPDNLDAFVRLLAETLGVRAEPRDADTTVLWPAR